MTAMLLDPSMSFQAPVVVPVSDSGVSPCLTHDPELWFAESPSDVERAKSLCQACPARRRCLDSALERREPWGVWGGELLLQGVVIPRKRPRGRPRKNPDAGAAA